MKINPTIFRAYDIRGIYPTELNEDVAYRIARSYAEFYPMAKKIVVAQDTRMSSPSLSKAVIKGLLDGGKEVVDIGIGPDPLFYFSILNKKFDGGIMISGSHNTKEYNGLMMSVKKPNSSMVEEIINEELDGIKNLAMSDKEFLIQEQANKIEKLEIAKEYEDYVAKIIKLSRPLKVIIDSSNGACGFLPEKIFKKLGCEVKTIYGDFDGTFPNHFPDPYKEENLKDIKKAVIQEKADIGFCFDTDGDRVAVIDNQGRDVNGDFCMFLATKYVLKQKRGPIVHDMRISKAFLDEMKKQGIETHFSVCHHKAVVDNIVKYNAVFGGEITLHFFFPLSYYLCDDAVFAALKLAEAASEHADLAKFVDNLPRYYASPEIFIDAPDELKFGMVEKLTEYLKENNYNFVDVDGARINLPNGWALMRGSNTSPMLKCRFEGDTPEDLISIEKEMLEIFKKVGMPINDKVYRGLGIKI
ncbi:MAG: phosphomannomutase/phosphoglucomutase [Candidatus Pacebacteria bacterium]|nr:phosphomannomutase/phosphoglucomutase [Candidatus Paceibacterota bacterium]